MSNRDNRRKRILHRVLALCACINTAAITGILPIDPHVVQEALIEPGQEGYVSVFFRTTEHEKIAGLFTEQACQFIESRLNMRVYPDREHARLVLFNQQWAF